MYLFSSALYKLIFVLHKAVLFHLINLELGEVCSIKIGRIETVRIGLNLQKSVGLL